MGRDLTEIINYLQFKQIFRQSQIWENFAKIMRKVNEILKASVGKRDVPKVAPSRAAYEHCTHVTTYNTHWTNRHNFVYTIYDVFVYRVLYITLFCTVSVHSVDYIQFRQPKLRVIYSFENLYLNSVRMVNQKLNIKKSQKLLI